MTTGALAIILTFLMPLGLIVWNKMRVKGKILGCFARKDRSTDFRLCALRSSFVIYEDRAYDLYPDYMRLARYPTGWPTFFQELIPTGLWDEEDAVQKDWVTLDPPKEGSLSLRAALEENWWKKLVQEAGRQEGVGGLNWRRLLPIGLIAIGIGGVVVILIMRSTGGG